jgi:geranylgeranyl diphosphate synthase type II
MIEAYLESRRELVEGYLSAYLAQRAGEFPERLHAAINYALEGGKRLRPILLVAAAEAVGGAAEGVLPTAAAVELFHTYSLIHDDLPALDDATWRRERLSAHRVFGEAVALLAGDALIPLGFELIAKEQAKLSPEDRVLRVIDLMSEALGPIGMVGGQLLELEATEALPDEALLAEIYAKKTAALLGASLAAGGVLGGGTESEIEALQAFGQGLGLAYQLVDDLLDFGEDARPTYAHLLGERAARAEAERLTAEALAALEPLGKRDGAQTLRALGEWLLSRRV